MFALISVIAGTAVGCGVCAFGMWSFLKGIGCGTAVKNGGVPELFPQKNEKGENSPSIAQQLSSMFKTERG
jgi:hypothetical protein